MHVICLDLEMNQTGEASKIIELGYVIFNPKNKAIKVKRSLIINPEETLNPEIIELTGITQEMVDAGMSLTEAYNIMCDDMKKFSVFRNVMEWGTDHMELRKQLELSWAEYIFGVRSLDVKSLFQMYTMTTPNTKTVAGLKKAMEILGLSFVGRQHRGADDAKNTVLVYFALTDKMRLADHIKNHQPGLVKLEYKGLWNE